MAAGIWAVVGSHPRPAGRLADRTESVGRTTLGHPGLSNAITSTAFTAALHARPFAEWRRYVVLFAVAGMLVDEAVRSFVFVRKGPIF